jgi:hypothetical protein
VAVYRAETLGDIHGLIDDDFKRNLGFFLQLVKTQQEDAAFHRVELRQWPVGHLVDAFFELIGNPANRAQDFVKIFLIDALVIGAIPVICR